MMLLLVCSSECGVNVSNKVIVDEDAAGEMSDEDV